MPFRRQVDYVTEEARLATDDECCDNEIDWLFRTHRWMQIAEEENTVESVEWWIF
jgi:hypothetical protein